MKRLRNEFFGADFKSFQTMLGGAQRSHEHDREFRALFDVSPQLESRSVGQSNIQNHEVPISLVQLFQRPLLRFDPRDVVLFAQQTLVQSCAERSIIFDQQQSLHNRYAPVRTPPACSVPESTSETRGSTA